MLPGGYSEVRAERSAMMRKAGQVNKGKVRSRTARSLRGPQRPRTVNWPPGPVGVLAVCSLLESSLAKSAFFQAPGVSSAREEPGPAFQ